MALAQLVDHLVLLLQDLVELALELLLGALVAVALLVLGFLRLELSQLVRLRARTLFVGHRVLGGIEALELLLGLGLALLQIVTLLALQLVRTEVGQIRGFLQAWRQLRSGQLLSLDVWLRLLADCGSILVLEGSLLVEAGGVNIGSSLREVDGGDLAP